MASLNGNNIVRRTSSRAPKLTSAFIDGVNADPNYGRHIQGGKSYTSDQVQLAILGVKIELGEREFNKLQTHKQYEVVAKCISQQHHGYSTGNISTSTTFTAAAGNNTTNSNTNDDSPDTLLKLSSVKKYGTATSTNNGKSSSLQLVGSGGGAANYNGGIAKDKSPTDFLDTHQLQSTNEKKRSSNNRPSAVGLEDENTKNGSKSPGKPTAAGAATPLPLSPRKLSPPQFSIPKPTSKPKLSSSLLDFDSVGLRNTPKEKSNDDISGVDSNGSNKKRKGSDTNHTLAGRKKESRYEKYTSTTNNNNITVIRSISCVSNESPTSSHPKQCSLESKNRLLYQISVKDIPSLSRLPTEWQDKDLTHRSDLGNITRGCSDWHAYPGKTDDEKRRNRGLDDSEVNGPRNTGAWNEGPFRQISGTEYFECCKDSGGCGAKFRVTEVHNIKTTLKRHKKTCLARIESLPLTLGLPMVSNETTGELERVCWCLKNLATLNDEGIVHAKYNFARHEATCKTTIEGIVPTLAHYTELFPERKKVSKTVENNEMDWTKKDSQYLFDKLKRNITQTNVIADVKCFGFNDGGATLPILLSREENEVAEETLQAVIDSAGEDDGVVDAAAVEAAKKKGFSRPFIEYEVKEAGLSMPAIESPSDLEGSHSDSDDDTTTKKKAKKDHPYAPKHDMSSFFLYSSATYTDIKAANREATAKHISTSFKALPADERLYWDRKAAEINKQKAESSSSSAGLSMPESMV